MVTRTTPAAQDQRGHRPLITHSLLSLPVLLAFGLFQLPARAMPAASVQLFRMDGHGMQALPAVGAIIEAATRSATPAGPVGGQNGTGVSMPLNSPDTSQAPVTVALASPDVATTKAQAMSGSSPSVLTSDTIAQDSPSSTTTGTDGSQRSGSGGGGTSGGAAGGAAGAAAAGAGGASTGLIIGIVVVVAAAAVTVAALSGSFDGGGGGSNNSSR